jgi:hypothetical protein
VILFLIFFLFYSPASGTLVKGENDCFIFFYPRRCELAKVAVERESIPILKKMVADIGMDKLPEGKVRVIILPPFAEGKKGEENLGVPGWAAGIAYPGENLIVIRTASFGDQEHKGLLTIFRHELAHLLLYHYLGANYYSLPSWFNEAVAMWQAKEWSFDEGSLLSRALIFHSLIPLSELAGSFPSDYNRARLAYTEALSFFLYLRDRKGEEGIRALLYQLKQGKEFTTAFSLAFGGKPEEIEAKWLSSLNFWYKWVPVVTSTFSIFFLITALFLIAYIRKRARTRELLRRFDEEELSADSRGS